MKVDNKKPELTEEELIRVSGGNLGSGWIRVHCNSCNQDFDMEDPACSIGLASCPKCGDHECLDALWYY